MIASANSLDTLPIILVFVVTVVFILASYEAGFRVGEYLRPLYANGAYAPLLPMVGSTLAMLAFVLAITPSMAA